MAKQAPRFYEFGEHRIDVRERVLQRGGQPIPLTLKAFDLLLFLVQNHGHIVEKDKLLEGVWPDSFVEESNLTVNMSTLRRALGDTREESRFIETVSKRGYRFIAGVREFFEEDKETDLKRHAEECNGSRLAIPMESIEPVGGAVPLDSNFYIVRPVDEEFRAAIARQDSIILIKGARQMGKTSLLARGLQRAREAGAKVILTDFQVVSLTNLNSPEALFLSLGNSIAEQLDLDVSPSSVWKSDNSPNANFEKYMRKEVLKKLAVPVVWGLDEVDRLFNFDYGSEVFSLFRSWHNLRSLDPDGPWHQLTLAIAYATEAHLFIKDVNQSPFNVGTHLKLKDFTIGQVLELNQRYGSPLQNEAELERFYSLVGGHPYLVRRGLYEMAHSMELEELETQADRDESPLEDHLRRILGMLMKDAGLCDVVRGILQGQPCPSVDSFYRLRSAGIIVGDTTREARSRCQLYSRYLRRHLL
jgi:DNA-binding winged helix-turn-helix (wHTH) protein